MQKGDPENLGLFRGGPEKKYPNLTWKIRVYLKFCGVNAYFFTTKKGGSEKSFGPKGGGALKNFRGNFFVYIRPPPNKCLWMIP